MRGEDGKEIRRAFVPEEGCLFFSADYSQIELRVMAHLSGDENMQEAFREGYDIHAATAAKIYHETMDSVTRDQRTKAKRANFGIIYGITVFGLAERLDISRHEATQLIDGYFATFPRVADYMEQAKQTARERRLRRNPDAPPPLPCPTSRRTTPPCAASPSATPSTPPYRARRPT